PEMNGLEATAEIRRRESQIGGGRVPIVAVTAHALKGEAERCLAAGMDDCITKPISLTILSSKIAQWIQPETRRAAAD
ncbi:MAG: response regulator, partial [Nitratireductor sp.]|nr:response regulator [Nitratireductor sp.]